jgi:hypothetical protein
MTRLLAAVLILVLADSARAEDFEDAATGFRLKGLDGWFRDPTREREPIVLSILRDFGMGRQIRFEVEAGYGVGLDPDTWISSEREARLAGLAEVTEKFTEIRNRTVAGKAAVGYTISGSNPAGNGLTDTLRFRVFMIVHADNYIRFAEISYNGAHEGEEALLDGTWKAITLEDPSAHDIDTTVPEAAAGSEVTDKLGNARLRLPPGWSVREGPAERATSILRLVAVRTNGAGREIAQLDLLRYTHSRGSFLGESAGSLLSSLCKDDGLLDFFYGRGATPAMDVDESVPFGGARQAAAYRVADWTNDQLVAIRRMEDEKSRGARTDVPKPPKRVLHGRIALLSPYAYVVRAWFRDTQDGDNAVFLAEIKAILDSFAFLDPNVKIAGLETPDGALGDTLAQAATATDRPDQILIRAFEVTRPESTVPAAVLKVEFVIPKGFVRPPEKEGNGDSGHRLLLVAQDEHQNYATIVLRAGHLTEIAPPTPKGARSFPGKKAVFERWCSHWESTARGDSPREAKAMKVGGLGGHGAIFLGTLQDAPAGLTCIMADHSNWRIELAIQTRGDVDKRIKQSIQTFLKELKISKG